MTETSAKQTIDLTIVIPAYNEEDGLRGLLPKLVPMAKEKGWNVIVVDDGSSDGTAQVVQEFPYCRLIRHPHNIGYGAAIKTGVRHTDTAYFLLLDSDGQHNPEEIPLFLEDAEKYDMVVGVRQKGSDVQVTRVPGKKILSLTANYLTGQKIPDINSGFRLVRKKAFMDFMHIYPNGFSISTTPYPLSTSFEPSGYSLSTLGSWLTCTSTV